MLEILYLHIPKDTQRCPLNPGVMGKKKKKSGIRRSRFKSLFVRDQ